MSTDAKKAWIAAEAAAGVREIEVGSFVPAKLLPQLADTGEVVGFAKTLPDLTVAVLVPNARGATGDGGAVKVATHGIIQTSGAGSTGLIVQSIGGGGGAAVAVDADGLVREPIVEPAKATPPPRTTPPRFARTKE